VFWHGNCHPGGKPRIPRIHFDNGHLTPERTASGQNVAFQMPQTRTVAAMRWRASVGLACGALPILTARLHSCTSAAFLPLPVAVPDRPLASRLALRPGLRSPRCSPSALLPIAPPLAVSWPAVAAPARWRAPVIVSPRPTVGPPRPHTSSPCVLPGPVRACFLL
jgi:hypothetical protein